MVSHFGISLIWDFGLALNPVKNPILAQFAESCILNVTQFYQTDFFSNPFI